MRTELTFLSTDVTIWASIVVFAIAIFLCFFAWRRSAYRKRVGALEALRLIIIGLVLFTLNQPEWLTHEDRDRKAVIAVLRDTSGSMQTKDVAAGEAGDKLVTRAEGAKSFIEDSDWTAVADRHTVSVQSFPSAKDQEGAPEVRGTNLSQPLDQLIEDEKNLRAVVIVSDGDWNQGSSPLIAAARLRAKNVQIHTAAVGAETALPDIELKSFDARASPSCARAFPAHSRSTARCRARSMPMSR